MNQMNQPIAQAPKNISSGLILMTVFTIFWSAIAYYGCRNSADWWLPVLFVLPCLFFAYYAIQLKQAAQHSQLPASAPDDDQVKKKEKWFMIICAAEGIGMFLAANIVVNLHHPELQVPAIALPVALHFFPLAKIFDRKMDYYIGAWSTMIAVLAMVLVLNHTLGKMQTIAFTGIGLAVATTCYGINMTLKARRTLVH